MHEDITAIDWMDMMSDGTYKEVGYGYAGVAAIIAIASVSFLVIYRLHQSFAVGDASTSLVGFLAGIFFTAKLGNCLTSEQVKFALLRICPMAIIPVIGVLPGLFLGLLQSHFQIVLFSESFAVSAFSLAFIMAFVGSWFPFFWVREAPADRDGAVHPGP